MLRPPRVVLFDLDGTLVDSLGDIAAACNHTLRELGRPELPEAVVAGFVGDGVRALLTRALGAGATETDLDAAVASFQSWYAAHPAGRTRWLRGAEEAIDAAAESGAAVGLVTNKARSVTERVLEALGAAERFAFLYAGGDGPLKPDPEPIRRAAAALGASVGETWMVGDGAQDVGAAKRAGCAAIAVLGGFGGEAAVRAQRPDVVLGSLAELPALIRSARS